MGDIGPVEYVVIAFPGNRFKGEIVPAIAELEDNGVVHILDVVFIKKDADGLITSFEYDGLDDVLEFGFEDIDGEAGGMLNNEDLQLVAEGLEPDSSAALIVWEHRWAARVARPSGTPAAASSAASGSRTRSSGSAGRRPAGGVTERGQRCDDVGSGESAVRDWSGRWRGRRSSPVPRPPSPAGSPAASRPGPRSPPTPRLGSSSRPRLRHPWPRRRPTW